MLIVAQDTTYFSSDMMVTNKGNAEFYRITDQNEEGSLVRVYSMNGVLLNFTQYKSLDPMVKNGHAIEFDEDGDVKEMGFYKDDLKDSIWTKYDKNSNVVSQLVYKENSIIEILKTGRDIKALGEITDTSIVASVPQTLPHPVSEPINADSVLTLVEQMPVFPGGEEALQQFIKTNIKYPKEAKEKRISGRVYVNFIIGKDGVVRDAKIVRGIGGGCDEELVRIVNLMPPWTPGMHAGEPVNISYSMPVYFSL